MNKAIELLKEALNYGDSLPRYIDTKEQLLTKYIKAAIAELAKQPDLETENEDLQRRLMSHIKGESVENICSKCHKHFWNVDDEAIICPFCKCGDMPLHPERNQK